MNLLDEAGEGLDGLSQVRAMLASGRKPGIARSLDFQLAEIESGRRCLQARPASMLTTPSEWFTAGMPQPCSIPHVGLLFIRD
jgi:hypothetical protein